MASTVDIDRTSAPLEVVIAFELTARMRSWLKELSSRFKELLERLQADIPGIKVAVLPYGNYNGEHMNARKWVHFTEHIPFLCQFVRNTIHSTEVDIPEFVLNEARTQLSWTPGSRRVLVMMGNHASINPDFFKASDVQWKCETRDLANEGVTIYALQCWHYLGVPQFFKTITSATNGKHLILKTEPSVFDALMAICYREANKRTLLANYEKEARDNCLEYRLLADIESIFASLRQEKVGFSLPTPGLLEEKGDISDTSIVKKVTPLKSTSTKRKIKSVKSLPLSNLTLPLKRAAKKAASVNIITKQMPKKTKPSLDAFKESNLPLLKRENVPESNFSLRLLPWSPWRLAINSCDGVSKDNKELWERRPGRSGYRLKVLPLPQSSSTRVSDKPVLYEVAVQGSGASRKRYVVFSAISSCSLGVSEWERRLLGETRSQVDLVLNSGGHVYVRLCLLTSKSLLETSRKGIRRYDYAWRKMRRMKKCARDLVKGSFVISESEL